MRQFTLAEPTLTTTDWEAITFHMAGQTVSFVDGVCNLADPSPVQLVWLDDKIKQGLITETTPDKKKTKPSKRAAKKKRG